MIKLIFQLVSNFWQELLYLISIVVLLLEILNYNISKNSIDNWDLVLVLLIFPLFISIITHLFWRNRIFSKIVSILFSIVSFIVILMAIYYVHNSTSKQLEAYSMLFFGIILLIAALSMNLKYKKIAH